MRESEVRKEISEQRLSNQVFIKWWRKEQDLLDFDLIDRFLEGTGENREIGGYELYTVDQMWNELKKVCGERVAKGTRNGQSVVTWMRKGEERSCPFIPESLLEIFDVETRGNYVD